MNRATYFFAAAALFFTTAAPALAQDEAAPAVTSTTITTKLSAVVLDEPAEEGFATIRIADEAGEAVYRGMMPVAAGARSLDLSAVSIPATGRYTLRVVYPGGTVTKELETLYTAGSAPADALAGR